METVFAVLGGLRQKGSVTKFCLCVAAALESQVSVVLVSVFWEVVTSYTRLLVTDPTLAMHAPLEVGLELIRVKN